MKVIGALYLVFVLITTTFGAYLGSEALCQVLAARPAHFPWVAGFLHIVLFGVVFFQGLLMHLRVPMTAVLLLGFLFIEGALLAGLHFLA